MDVTLSSLLIAVFKNISAVVLLKSGELKGSLKSQIYRESRRCSLVPMWFVAQNNSNNLDVNC